MTVTLDEMAKRKATEVSAEQAAATELVRLAKEQGLSLTGPDGLLKLLTKSVIETALSEEMTEHLGYEKHDPAGDRGGEYPQRDPVQDGDLGQQRPGRDRRAPGPGRDASSRRSSRNASGAWARSTRSCCRCTPRG